jgi:hypothetical protein
MSEDELRRALEEAVPADVGRVTEADWGHQ